MKQRLNIVSSFLSVAIILLMHSCSKDYIPELIQQKGFEIQLNISNNSEIETRSASNSKERYIKEGYIFVFDPSSGAQKNNYKLIISTDITGNGEQNPKINARVKISKDDRVVFVFNTIWTGTDIGNVTYDNIDSHFPLSGEIPLDGEIPMYGEMKWGAVTNNPVHIRRAVAKIQILMPHPFLPGNDVTGLFKVGTVAYKIYQRAEGGHVKALSTNATPPASIINSIHENSTPVVSIPDYIGSSSDGYFPVSIPSDGNFVGSSYLYEYEYSKYVIGENSSTPIAEDEPDPSRLAIIIAYQLNPGGRSAIYRYYRLDLCNQEPDGTLEYLDIMRNSHYKVNIAKVNSHGYATAKEALNSPASNIEYEIIDDSGEHTLSNGQYAISVSEKLLTPVSNTIYPTSLQIATNLRYILGDGLTNFPSDITNTIELISDNAATNGVTLSLSKLSDTSTPLSVNFSKAYAGPIAFKITLGNLNYVSDPIQINYKLSLKMIKMGLKNE